MINNYGYNKIAFFYDLDLTNRKFNDVLFYKKILNDYNCQNVLELGCGTGRVSLALLKLGFKNITSLDISREMLKIFYENPLSNNIKIIEGDMSNFSIDGKFDCILIPFRSFQCLIEDTKIKNFFKVVKKHLTKKGVLVINTFIPIKNMSELENDFEEISFDLQDISYKKTTMNGNVNKENQTLNYSVKYKLENINSKEISESFKIKYYYPNQLIELIKSNDFVPLKNYIGFEKNDQIDASDFTVVCKHE